MFERDSDDESETFGWPKPHIQMTEAEHKRRGEIVDVSCGWNMTAAVNKDGEVIVWGNGTNSQLGQAAKKKNKETGKMEEVAMPQLGKPNRKAQNVPVLVKFPPESEKAEQVFCGKVYKEPLSLSLPSPPLCLP